MSRQGLEAVETIERDGFRAHIYYDDDPESPKDWDQLGTLLTWHRRWCPDEDGSKRFGEPSDFLEHAKAEDWSYLPVSLYEHSGMTIWVGGGNHPFDAAGWDSGQVGYIYTTPKQIEVIGVLADEVEKVLALEVQAWDQYIRGDIYQVTIEGPDGETLESCGGFYGIEYAKQHATQQLDYEIKHQRKEAEKIQRMMAL